MNNAFAPTPPEWTKPAIHAIEFCCPRCKTPAAKAQQVWLNRRAPVTTDLKRKYQEFYLCTCNTSWWGWSSDRLPSNLKQEQEEV